MPPLSPQSFINGLNARLEPPLQKHLKNVYASVALATMMAAVGGYVHLFTQIMSAGWVSSLGAMGFLIALIVSDDDNGKNRMTRLGYMSAFAFLSGVGMGPILRLSLDVDPTIIATALMLSSAIFVCFSLSALYAERAHYLYLGGILGSGLSILLVLGLANLFRSELIFQVQLYGGLLVFCAFVPYDTQMIIERFRRGEKDYVWHGVMLFIDFLDIFRHILIILIKASDNKKKK